MGPPDHLVAAFFALLFPLVTAPGYARRRAAMLSGDRRVRRREYLETIGWLAGMGIATILAWWLQGRDPLDIGLRLTLSWRGGTALLVSVTACVGLVVQVAVVEKSADARAAARRALGAVREYFPRTATERRLFRGVAISAGIGEELFYRGFLIWYFGEWIPLSGAVVLSSLAFGLAHIMHGKQAAFRSTLMGVALAGLYLLGGSLLAPMILHTAVDLTTGIVGSSVYADRSSVPD